MDFENTLFIFDLDGTLIKTGEKFDRKLAKIIKILIEKSGVLIATARHPRGVQYVFKPFFDFIPTISLNGAGLHLKSWSSFDKTFFFSRKDFN